VGMGCVTFGGIPPSSDGVSRVSAAEATGDE